MMNPLRDATCRSLQTTYEDIRPAKTADIKALHRSQKAHADMLTVGFQREMDRLIAMKHDEDFERGTQTNSSVSKISSTKLRQFHLNVIPLDRQLTIGDVHGAVESLLQQYGLQPIGRARPEALSSSSSSLRPVQMQRPTPTSHLIRQPDFTENLERRVERMLSGTQAASMPVLPMVVPIQVEDEMPVLRLRRCGTIVERARPDIPKTTSVRDALRQWFLPNSHAQAPYALQDWPTEWYMRARTPADTAVLMVYSQRARLGEAYSSVNEGSTDFTERGWDVFKQRYPQKTIMKTVTAIRAELAESGKITARTRSK